MREHIVQIVRKHSKFSGIAVHGRYVGFLHSEDYGSSSSSHSAVCAPKTLDLVGNSCASVPGHVNIELDVSAYC